MRLDDLRTFLVMADSVSLHQAASALGSTQSALSKTLTRLEQEVGMQLLERTQRGVALTSTGRSLQQHARRILLAVGDMESDLGDQRVARSGAVRIATLPHLLTTLFSPLLAQFFSSRPMATFSIDTYLSPHLIGALKGGEVDLVCGALPDHPMPDIAVLPLGPLALQIVARENHPRIKKFRSLADLSEEKWIMSSRSVYLRQWIENHFVSLGLPPPRVALESRASPVAFAGLLRQSDLIGVMPVRLLKQNEGHGLAALQGENMSWAHELAVLWRANGYLTPLCEDFRDALVEWCKVSGI